MAGLNVLPPEAVGLARHPGEPPFPDMVWIPGGVFRMGSDKHYPEEAPAHPVSVDGFWMDRTPVTNLDFERFLNATGYVTFAQIPPRAEEYPGALPAMLYAGSMVFFKPRRRVDLGALHLVAVRARSGRAPSTGARKLDRGA